MSDKKENHKTLVVRITEILPIKDADKIELVKFGMPYQCVSQKGTFKVGDLAVYIQPDSVVPCTEPFKFIWEAYIQTDGTVPEKRRRITVKKMRGEWSEGLLLPISDFSLQDLIIDAHGKASALLPSIGDDVSDRLGITHWDPDTGQENSTGQNIHAPNLKKKYPRSIRGWVYMLWRYLKGDRRTHVDFSLPVYDVEALKNYRNAIDPGTPVVVTEKIHGSNARYVFLDGTMYAGSRTLFKSPSSNCIWREALKQNRGIEEWCREHEGFALYGEVVPTQKGFDYGCRPGEAKFFLFDIRHPDGHWLDYQDPLQFTTFAANIKSVPLLYVGEYDEDKVKLLSDDTKSFAGLLTSQSVKHIREGIVIKLTKERLGRRAQYKVVNNTFLEKDSK
jgi:RNA ligase